MYRVELIDLKKMRKGREILVRGTFIYRKLSGKPLLKFEILGIVPFSIVDQGKGVEQLMNGNSNYRARQLQIGRFGRYRHLFHHQLRLQL